MLQLKTMFSRLKLLSTIDHSVYQEFYYLFLRITFVDLFTYLFCKLHVTPENEV